MSVPARYDNATQHNFMVHAALRWNNNTEARLFALALGCIHKNDKELPGIVIRFGEVFANQNGSNYETLENACKNLMRQVVMLRKVRSKSKNTKMYNIFHELELDSGTGLITGTFHENIEPYLLDLTEHFTVVEIEMLLRLKSPYAHRLLWYFKSEMYKEEEVFIDLVTFRKMLLGEDHHKHYPEYFNFKRFVLIPTLEELETEIGWKIGWSETKTGLRKITGLRFDIPQIPSMVTTQHITTKKPKKNKQRVVSEAPTATPVPVAAGESNMRVNEDEPAPLSQLLQAPNPAPTTAQPGTVHSEYALKIKNRFEKLDLTSTQIAEVQKHVGQDQDKFKKLFAGTQQLLQDVETKSRVIPNVGAETVKRVKTLLPGLYHEPGLS